jgi:precorrin-6B methylase 2
MLKRVADWWCVLGAIVTALSAAGAAPAQQAAPTALRAPDVRFEPTAADVAKVMLQLAEVRPGDVVFDLGCGDGRLVIAAARDYGAQGVCVDIDPRRITESRDNARVAGVVDRIRFVNDDLLTTDLSGATVVMLFLSPGLNLAVRPRLLRELRPGTRVVSHWHDMGDWAPRKTVRVMSEGIERPVYMWIIPTR